MSKAFFDTTILVCQMDQHDEEKREKCRVLVRNAAAAGEAVISTQVMQEFYVTTTAKLQLDPLLMKNILHSFENMEVVTIGTDIINQAIDISLQYKVSFWDALVVAAAESAKCETVYSKDLNDGQLIRNVRVINPLH